MDNLLLFTDGSVDSKTKTGFGAYLAVSNVDYQSDDLIEKVKTKRFENTSSTTLELQTLLWAVDEVMSASIEITSLIIYTDSQNVLGLQARRSGLEHKDYYANNGKRLKNAGAYQNFYAMMDRYNVNIIKVDGHKPRHAKNDIDKIFALVDKASRLSLRRFLSAEPVKI